MLTPAAFRAAVDAYEFTDEAVPPHARDSLVVGHAHGFRAAWEPALFYAIARDIDATVLAFEWSFDELGPLVDGLLRTGRLDVDALWALPAAAEAFCGDGRLTAGHVALLERLAAEGRLHDVVLFDRLAADGPERSPEMASRLAARWDRSRRLLAVVGRLHLPVFREHLPDVAQLDLDYEGRETGTAVVPAR